MLVAVVSNAAKEDIDSVVIRKKHCGQEKNMTEDTACTSRGKDLISFFFLH